MRATTQGFLVLAVLALVLCIGVYKVTESWYNKWVVPVDGSPMVLSFSLPSENSTPTSTPEQETNKQGNSTLLTIMGGIVLFFLGVIGLTIWMLYSTRKE
jgi:hypothetical protein